MLPNKTTTIQELIASSSNTTLSYKSFSFMERLSDNSVISVHDVVSDYITELRNASVTIKLTDEQYRKYVYKPKLLCNDIYGNPELYFIILLLNDIADVKEFNKTKFLMLTKDSMSLLASYIYNSESKAIGQYNTSHS